jgi:hypothetical protein
MSLETVTWICMPPLHLDSLCGRLNDIPRRSGSHLAVQQSFNLSLWNNMHGTYNLCDMLAKHVLKLAHHSGAPPSDSVAALRNLVLCLVALCGNASMVASSSHACVLPSSLIGRNLHASWHQMDTRCSSAEKLLLLWNLLECFPPWGLFVQEIHRACGKGCE